MRADPIVENDVSVLMDITNTPRLHDKRTKDKVDETRSDELSKQKRDDVADLVLQCADLPSEAIDKFSLMQRHDASKTTQCKASPFTDAQDDLLQAFREGHVQPQNGQGNADSPESPTDSDGYEPSIASHGVSPHAPSDEEGRQDVYLYHLADAPIRAMLI
eukprot:s4736_g3.t1